MLIRPITLLGAVLLAASSAVSAAAGCVVAGSIAGPDGGWDYASVDPATRRLYVAHGTAITAVDLATGTVTAALASAARPHQVLPIPGSRMLLETDGGTGGARLLDAASGAERARIKVGDPSRKRLFVPAGGSGTLAVLAEAPGKISLAGTVNTEVSARTGAVDPSDGKVYLPAARMIPPAQPGGRRQQVPSSFHLIVVAPR